MDFDCCAVCQRDRYGTNFFCLNDLTRGSNEINTLGPSVGEEALIVAQMPRCTRVLEPGTAKSQGSLDALLFFDHKCGSDGSGCKRLEIRVVFMPCFFF